MHPFGSENQKERNKDQLEFTPSTLLIGSLVDGYLLQTTSRQIMKGTKCLLAL